jgi:hypothetical protein
MSDTLEFCSRCLKPVNKCGNCNQPRSVAVIEKLEKRIAELEAALESTNNELSASITRLNTLKSVAPTHEVNEPDYSDFQTCHENSVILSKHQQPAKEQG